VALGHCDKLPDHPADQALKARFTLVVHPTGVESEWRFQRWRFGTVRILGRCPKLILMLRL
jgi:hypothetical protein